MDIERILLKEPIAKEFLKQSKRELVLRLLVHEAAFWETQLRMVREAQARINKEHDAELKQKAEAEAASIREANFRDLSLMKLNVTDRKVISLISEGYSRSQIADRICLSKDAVKKSCQRIRKHTGITDIKAIASLCRRLNIPRE
jgi:DNA-binding NarL/FixJ family response regulator